MIFGIREKEGIYYIERQASNGTVLFEQQKYPTYESAEKYFSELKKEKTIENTNI